MESFVAGRTLATQFYSEESGMAMVSRVCADILFIFDAFRGHIVSPRPNDTLPLTMNNACITLIPVSAVRYGYPETTSEVEGESSTLLPSRN